MIKKCFHCGKKFEVTKDKKKYCSLKCFYKHIKRKPVRCKNCNKLFIPKKTSKGRGQYCSRQCFNDFRRKRKDITAVCNQCGKTFTRLKWRVMAEGREKPQFCSQQCYWKFLKGKGNIYKCNSSPGFQKVFNKDRKRIFNLYESGLKIKEIAKIFKVSDSTMRRKMKDFNISTRTSGFYSKNNSEQYIRNYLNKKYNHICQKCGWDKTTCDACHIIPRRDNGNFDYSNMILLCPNCHRLFDSGIISKKEIEQIKDEDIVRST